MSQNKRSLVVTLLLLLMLPVGVYLAQQTQDIRERAQETTAPNNKPPKPEYAPGEVLVKLKTPLSDTIIDPALKRQGQSFDTQGFSTKEFIIESLPESIKTVHNKFSLKTIEKVFRGAKEPVQELQSLKTRFADDFRSGTRRINEQEFLKVDLSRTYKITFDPSVSVEKVVDELSKSQDLEYAEPNYIRTTTVIPNDQFFPNQWNLNNSSGSDIDAPEAWDITTGDPEILVAVIDSGVDYNHPDLTNQLWINPYEIPDNGIDDDSNGFIDDVRGWDFWNDDNDPFDIDYHGTAVTGIIGASTNNASGVAGIVWNTRILPLKALENRTGGTTEVAYATYYAINAGADVINASYGGEGAQTELEAIELANNLGILFVAGAGNYNGDNDDASKFYPASYDLENIISVAATDSTGNLESYSNYGATSVDLAAPAHQVWTTHPDNKYGTFNGTSAATPHVTGAAALLMSYFTNETYTDIKNRIINSVTKNSYLTGKVFSGGVLNINNALNLRFLSLNYKSLSANASADPGNQSARNSAIGASGNYYTSGNFQQSITINGQVLHTETGDTQEGFVAKFDTNNNVVWLKQIGNDNNIQQITKMVIDPQENVYVLGEFFNAISIDDVTVTKSGLQVFIAKLDQNGQVEWLRSPQESFNPKGISMVVDSQNNYIVVTFSNSSFDYRVVKYLPDSQSAWEQQSYVPIIDLAVDQADNVIVFNRFGFSKYTSENNLIYSQNIPEGISIKRATVDGSGNIYVIESYPEPERDYVLMKYSPEGEVIGNKRIEGPLPSQSNYSLAIDENNNVYVFSQSDTTIRVENTALAKNAGSILDPYVLVFDSSGGVLAGLFLAASNEITPYSLAVSNDEVILYGDYSGVVSLGNTALPETTSKDVFLFKLKLDAFPTLPTPTLTPINTPTPTATPTPSTIPTPTPPPNAGTGLYLPFEGTAQSDYVTLTDSSGHFSVGDEMSIELWVRPERFSVTSTVLGKFSAAHNDWVYTFTLDNISQSQNQSKPTFYIHTTPSSPKLQSQNPIPDNGSTWTHIGITKDNNTYKLYVNGILEDTKTSTSSVIDQGNAELSIGTYLFGSQFTTSYFGAIDDLRISNTVRDIATNWTTGAYLQPLAADLNTLGLWRFENDLEDSSIHNNDGISTGTISYTNGIVASNEPIITPTPSTSLPGDTDGDGDIDLVDLVKLLTNFGGSGGIGQGDTNSDGVIDLLDLTVLLRDFGK